jgi:hypothetical protein
MRFAEIIVQFERLIGSFTSLGKRLAVRPYPVLPEQEIAVRKSSPSVGIRGRFVQGFMEVADRCP